MPDPDILARRRRPAEAPAVPPTRGLWVQHRGSGFVGVVEDIEPGRVFLRDDSGLRREFRLEPRGFCLLPGGDVITLGRPVSTAAPAPAFTPSGAVAQPTQPARIARADRILVEGVHDAELLEKVWGDELRREGIVVEPMDGADDLVAEVQRRQPGPHRRLGVLLDHLVAGSKESRLAAAVHRRHVLVDGHEFVDVWQAIRPSVVGLAAWPQIPPGQPWKEGICAAFGVDESWMLWRRLLDSVRDYRDLEPSLVGAVERLLDFLLQESAH